MRKRRLLSFGQLAEGGRGRLGTLVERARRLRACELTMSELLPAHYHPHVHLARADARQWLILVDSSAWATRMRYELPQLRERLCQRMGKRIPKLRLQVRAQPEPPAAEPTPAALSPAAARHIGHVARTVQDPGLAEALARLARHGARSGRS